MDYLLLHTKVTERGMKYGQDDEKFEGSLQLCSSDDLTLAEQIMESEDDLVTMQSLQKATAGPKRRRIEASKEQIVTRKISKHRFFAIMQETPYDATPLIEDLADEDGMIPLDEIAHYHMDVEYESNLEPESESKSDEM